jgi:hypothetical protein
MRKKNSKMRLVLIQEFFNSFYKSIYTTQTKSTASVSDPDSQVISIDQSKRQRDSRLNKVMQDFHEPNDRRNQSRRQDDDDEDDICAMMDRFNK